MQEHCLVEKSGAGLGATLEAVVAARGELESGLSLAPESLIEGLSVRNLALASELVLRACLHRRETRSGHYRLDHPDRDDRAFRRSFLVRKDGDAVAIQPFDYDAPARSAAGA
jgi:succinate dehydrogenase/fumarate reductase flavoprotein subunit